MKTLITRSALIYLTFIVSLGCQVRVKTVGPEKSTSINGASSALAGATPTVSPTPTPNLTTLRSFKPFPFGNVPYGDLVLNGTTLYGLSSGVNGGAGVLFSMGIDGSSPQVLHSFTGGSDGKFPRGSLIIFGLNLYGMTNGGGAGGKGTIFSIPLTGGTLTTLYSFTGADGTGPQGSLAVSGSTLYGTTHSGGQGNMGSIFSIPVTGGSLTTLHSFAGTSDGAYPNGSLIVSGNTLYGLANGGGAYGNGTIYSLFLNSSNFINLHSFANVSDGASPNGGLILSGNTLYGITNQGGASGKGTIFSMLTSGLSFTNLHSFGGVADGASPNGSLILSSNTLYGMASAGGASGNGTIFSILTTGLSFANLHSFGGGLDGAGPYGSVILSGNVFYAMTASGGANSNGMVYSFPIGGGNISSLYSFTGSTDAASPYGNLMISGNTVYGTTRNGGASNMGSIFSMPLDGSSITLLHSFAGAADGAYPNSGLAISGSKLFGSAVGGGSGGNGTVFSLALDGTGFSVLYAFNGGADGLTPFGGVIVGGTNLFGMTYGDGVVKHGNIFSVSIPGGAFNVLYTFTGGADGGSPKGNLILSGSTLYGMTSAGGANSNGLIFSIGTGLAPSLVSLYSFSAGGADGTAPFGSLILSGSTLYGMTSAGGAGTKGTIFSISTTGTGMNTLYSFTGGADGATPQGSLVLYGNTLYGMTSAGGSIGLGTLFGFSLSGSSLSTLYTFTGNTDGGSPQGSLTLSGTSLYGMTLVGGTGGVGNVVQYSP